jgi:two-component system, LytTR family, sensor kinase
LLQKELNFLKNQFNSHITFNFLNFCYSKVHNLSEETAEAIDLFSSMLRYSLEIRPEQKVPLLKEIEYIKNFIELQKLLTSQVYVDFTCQGNFNDKLILPRILVTFVENAFKHGQFNKSSHPITISLKEHEDSICFKVINKRNNKKNLNNTGIGIENVFQVLNLYYDKAYKLNISDSENDYYESTLDLKLIK